MALELGHFMEKGDYEATMKIAAYEVWKKHGEPVGETWISDFLNSSEENYTLMIVASLEVLWRTRGGFWLEKENLEELVDHIADALLIWAE